ncbi:MAG: hypothetical protein HYW49_05680 [Deltaproteobacteria bacterium]|nr:hypothetical protein [Deltaproteobacteria bacterium]
MTECCAPPAGLAEEEKNVAELSKVAGECPTADEAGLASAKKDFAALFPEDAVKTEVDVYGIKLTGTAEQLAFAKKIVGGDGTSTGSRRPSAWPSIAKDCADVVCALAKLFGSEESALRALNVANRTGYFITASQFMNPAGVEQIWRASEIRTIDEVIQKAPENFRRLSTMKYFYRVHDGYRNAEDPNTAAQAVSGWGSGVGRIEVYAGTFSDEGFAAPAVLHELAHHLDFSGSIAGNLNRSTGFAKLSGWDEGQKKQAGADTAGNPVYKTVYASARTDNFITDYARTTPMEDWADTAAYYVYAPGLLKKVAPEKYALMKNMVFGGSEYGDEKWPALERAVSEAGGEPALIQECFGSLTEIAPHDEASVREILTEERGTVFWRSRPVEEFALRTQCLNKKADEIAASLKADPSFCGRGGVIAVEDTLRTKIMWPLRSILEAAVSAAKEPAATAEKRCFEKRDFTRPCAIGKDAIKAALLANPEFVALPETAQKQAGERILNLIASPGLTAAVLKEFTPARTLLACLMGVDVIHLNEEKVFYHTDMVELSDGIMQRWVQVATGVSVAKGCTRNLEKGWAAKGYAVDAPAERLAADVLKNERMAGIVKAFENEVVLKWAANMKNCGSDASARQSCMEGVLKSWAEKQKLGAEFDSAALTGRLLKTVNVE